MSCVLNLHYIRLRGQIWVITLMLMRRQKNLHVKKNLDFFLASFPPGAHWNLEISLIYISTLGSAKYLMLYIDWVLKRTEFSIVYKCSNMGKKIISPFIFLFVTPNMWVIKPMKLRHWMKTILFWTCGENSVKFLLFY